MSTIRPSFWQGTCSLPVFSGPHQNFRGILGVGLIVRSPWRDFPPRRCAAGTFIAARQVELLGFREADWVMRYETAAPSYKDAGRTVSRASMVV